MSIIIDWNAIPTYEIKVSDFKNHYDLRKVFKQAKIYKYIYRINYKGLVLKFGMSSDVISDPGERVYRQVGHAFGWDCPLKGSSGDDWYIIEQSITDQYGIVMHKDDLTIKIWDVTNYPFISITPDIEIKRMESELIQTYFEVVGRKPIGNIDDDEKVFKKGMISSELYNRYIEEN